MNSIATLAISVLILNVIVTMIARVNNVHRRLLNLDDNNNIYHWNYHIFSIIAQH